MKVAYGEYTAIMAKKIFENGEMHVLELCTYVLLLLLEIRISGRCKKIQNIMRIHLDAAGIGRFFQTLYVCLKRCLKPIMTDVGFWLFHVWFFIGN